jgi:hypothetical protein
MTARQNELNDIVLANGRVIDPETYLDGQMHVGITGAASPAGVPTGGAAGDRVGR